MPYQEEDLIRDTDKVILLNPSIEWEVLCMPSLLPIRFRRPARSRIDGEIGTIGNNRLIISKDDSAIKNVESLKSTLFPWKPDFPKD